MTLDTRAACIAALTATLELALGGGLALGKDVKLSLTGAEETPPVTTTASGSGTIKIADDKTVSGSIKTVGIDGIAAHIHVGAPGVAGPPIITLEKMIFPEPVISQAGGRCPPARSSPMSNMRASKPGACT